LIFPYTGVATGKGLPESFLTEIVPEKGIAEIALFLLHKSEYGNQAHKLRKFAV